MKTASRFHAPLRIALMLFLVVTSSSVAFAQRKSAPAAARTNLVSADSYARARKILDAGIEALGGLEAMRAAQDVSVKVRGFSYARHQSLVVNPPYDKMTRDEDLFIDVRNRRYIVETRDPFPGGFVFGGKQVITGNQGFFVNPRDKIITPLNLANFNNIGILRRVPHLFLLAAYENAPSTLRSLGRATYDRRPHDVITFASGNGLQWTLFFDSATKLLSKYELMVSDNVEGDAVQETIFPRYQTVGKLKVPARRITRRAGEIVEEVDYVEVKFNTLPAESAFAKPDGYEELPQQQPAATKETKLADGVYLFESGANSLVVEFKDHLMIIEPYAGGRGARGTIAKAREMFPNKPVRYVVITHHHDDHSGGLRPYIAEGVTVVTTAANQRYFEKMAGGTFTVNFDDQTRLRKKPIFEFLQNRKRVFSDGKQTVEIIDIGPSPHVNEMLIAYLPAEKIVFQGDLVNLPATGKYLPTTVNDTTVHFFDWIKRQNLNVDRIAAVHGPTTTLNDLRKAVEKKRDTN